MPRYFFHARSDKGLTRDEEGVNLPDVEAAHAEALKAAEQMWCNLAPDVARNDMAIEVTDEAGQAVLTVPFLEAAEHLAQGTGEPMVKELTGGQLAKQAHR